MTAPMTAWRPATDTGRCGTEAGHSRHRRRGEQPCRPCQDAGNQTRNGGRPLIRQVRAELESEPVPEWIGKLAGRSTPHNFVGMSVSQCGWCFGWRDDPRHPVVGGPEGAGR